MSISARAKYGQLRQLEHTALKVIERLPEFIEQMKSEDWHWCCVTDSGLSKRVQGEDNVHVSGPPEALEDNGYIAPVRVITHFNLVFR